MPKYRQTHTKLLDSEDFAAMPDDSTRLIWVLLPLIMDREGRCKDHIPWLCSRLFPYSEVPPVTKVATALDWLEQRGMILRYEALGRRYFCIPTWHQYQTGTDREAPSIIPGPEVAASKTEVSPSSQKSEDDPLKTITNTNTSTSTRSISADKVSTSSGSTPELLTSKSGQDYLAQMSTFIANLCKVPEYNGGAEFWVAGLKALADMGATERHVEKAYLSLKANKRKKYIIAGPQSLVNSVAIVMQDEDLATNGVNQHVFAELH